MAKQLASNPRSKLFHLTYRYMICFSISAPFPWGTQGRSGYCSQGERLHSGRDPKRFTGRNRESRGREAAGRRYYPEAVPKAPEPRIEDV